MVSSVPSRPAEGRRDGPPPRAEVSLRRGVHWCGQRAAAALVLCGFIAIAAHEAEIQFPAIRASRPQRRRSFVGGPKRRSRPLWSRRSTPVIPQPATPVLQPGEVTRTTRDSAARTTYRLSSPLETEPIVIAVVEVPPLENETASIEHLDIEPLTIEPLTCV